MKKLIFSVLVAVLISFTSTACNVGNSDIAESTSEYQLPISQVDTNDNVESSTNSANGSDTDSSTYSQNDYDVESNTDSDISYNTDSENSNDDKIEIPNLEGLTLSEAKTKLKELQLYYGGYSYMASDEKEDTVIGQNPPAGTITEPGAEVKVVLSDGPEREVTLSQEVDLPIHIDYPVTLEVIIYGVTDESYTTTIIPKESPYYTLTLTRMSTEGCIDVCVALNTQTYRVYRYDFKNNSVDTMEVYYFDYE